MQQSKWGIIEGQKDLESTQEHSYHYPGITFKVIVLSESLVRHH